MKLKFRTQVVLMSALVVALLVAIIALTACSPETTDVVRKEQGTVKTQDNTYLTSQPVPLFNYSLPRDLWIQFYKASTANVVRTWSVVLSDYGSPLFATESVGYPIPMDTQLTNPQKIADAYNGGYAILPQSEPNGLYTSPNTNATIIMTVDGNGKVAPVYSEPKVLAFPFPVQWNEKTHMFERIPGSKSNIQLDVKK